MVKFYYHGVDSSTKNIKLQKPIEFSPIVPIVETVQVPGRNGTLHIETGTYENREATAECFVLKSNAENEFTAINEFLFGNKGYQRLQTDEDNAHFWLAAIKNAAEINVKMQVLAPFEIKFDCKPQRFLISGETPIAMSTEGNVINPTVFEAKPLLKVYGEGNGEITISGKTISFEIPSEDTHVEIDSDLQDVFEVNAQNEIIDNLNSTASGAFPTIAGGTNAVTWSGDITSIVIVPRWWTL